MSFEENQEAAVHCRGDTSPDVVATSGQDDPTTVEPGSQYSPLFDVHLRTDDQGEVDFNKSFFITQYCDDHITADEHADSATASGHWEVGSQIRNSRVVTNDLKAKAEMVWRVNGGGGVNQLLIEVK